MRRWMSSPLSRFVKVTRTGLKMLTALSDTVCE